MMSRGTCFTAAEYSRNEKNKNNLHYLDFAKSFCGYLNIEKIRTNRTKEFEKRTGPLKINKRRKKRRQ